jgi:hypothetical protein
MKLRLVPFFAVLATTLVAQQANVPQTFDRDEIVIYRNFLVHYPEQMSNLIGMQDTTVAFEMPLESRPPAILKSLVIPAFHARKLPLEILALTTEQAVTARIAAKGTLVPSDKRNSKVGPDGYVRTHLTLSDIAFDPQHEHAVFIYSARCDCLGGQGGMVLYERKHGHWRLASIVDSWQG